MSFDDIDEGIHESRVKEKKNAKKYIQENERT